MADVVGSDSGAGRRHESEFGIIAPANAVRTGTMWVNDASAEDGFTDYIEKLKDEAWVFDRTPIEWILSQCDSPCSLLS